MVIKLGKYFITTLVFKDLPTSVPRTEEQAKMHQHLPFLQRLFSVTL